MATHPRPTEKQASLWQTCEEDSDIDNMSFDILMAYPPTNELVVQVEETFTQSHQEAEQSNPKTIMSTLQVSFRVSQKHILENAKDFSSQLCDINSRLSVQTKPKNSYYRVE
ncbi:hypothetical protein POM88_023156 [Heracleum sosnowskyi]|uniref:Uncharacterized protein n=1 Tax=Heracleum sosnowskyi TaxID=360622 RepID=A0AAD8II77_9APIA|nr:hypothetical protein POM88_023156 [Heracleum sosnowskyi]